MQAARIDEIGYRWKKPTWERTADRSWVLIVPSTYVEAPDDGPPEDAYFDRSQRLYQIFEFDGSWVDELHELQVERMLRFPGWRRDFSASAA